ncbi:C-factor [Platysternon megacephalum]|uniref:C-factor n=1 Tax=Platysternon megacephalum TaxID=55544 RepID=A0A4D9DH81_9SAUR|nr:C-factor [Platysternon megacephalum]
MLCCNLPVLILLSNFSLCSLNMTFTASHGKRRKGNMDHGLLSTSSHLHKAYRAAETTQAASPTHAAAKPQAAHSESTRCSLRLLPAAPLAQEFLPLLKRAAEKAGKEGLSCSKAAIINMSTKVGSIELCFKVLEIPMFPYRASKAALNMVTRCLAAELKDSGILCTAIHPGWVKTDMGTEKAPLTVECSVQGILSVLAGLSQATTGVFLDWEGKCLPW